MLMQPKLVLSQYGDIYDKIIPKDNMLKMVTEQCYLTSLMLKNVNVSLLDKVVIKMVQKPNHILYPLDLIHIKNIWNFSKLTILKINLENAIK